MADNATPKRFRIFGSFEFEPDRRLVKFDKTVDIGR
jgi:hypothetical protein